MLKLCSQNQHALCMGFIWKKYLTDTRSVVVNTAPSLNSTNQAIHYLIALNIGKNILCRPKILFDESPLER
jgi:hypothetical protein